MQLYNITEQIFLIMNFWSEQKCQAFIEKSEAKGYRDAAINAGGVGQRVVKSVRNNKRVMHTDVALAEEIWKDLNAFAPPTIGNSTAIGLNEMFRFYRYKPGEEFKKHRDQPYLRNSRETSHYTFMIYLNQNFEGGETTFNERIIKPHTGMALLFLHELEHAGSPVRKGVKYVLRTDIMYRLHETD